MYPGVMPNCLKDINEVEEMLIALVCPVMKVYVKTGGNYGYTGHVINLPQDVGGFAKTLPRRVEDLPIIWLKRKGKGDAFVMKKVRRMKVLKALQWLRDHNHLYAKVLLDIGAVLSLPRHDVPTNIGSIEFQEEDYPEFVPNETESDVDAESSSKSDSSNSSDASGSDSDTDMFSSSDGDTSNDDIVHESCLYDSDSSASDIPMRPPSGSDDNYSSAMSDEASDMEIESADEDFGYKRTRSRQETEKEAIALHIALEKAVRSNQALGEPCPRPNLRHDTEDDLDEMESDDDQDRRVNESLAMDGWQPEYSNRSKDDRRAKIKTRLALKVQMREENANKAEAPMYPEEAFIRVS
jgi:hypothetical protein